MKTIIWIVVLILVIVGIVKFSGDKEPVATGPIKIGVMAPLTGDGAAYGEPAVNIYKLALKEINDAGGIDGNLIELVIEDSKCSGEGGANAAQKLVNIDKVKIILGGICSGETLSAIPIAEAGKVAMISPGASSPDLTGKSRFFARNYPGDSAQGKLLADVAYNKQSVKSVYILAEQTDYAQGIAKVFSTEFTNFGGEVTSESFPSNVTDLRQVVTKAKAANPDAFMMVVQTPATGQKILKAMQDLQWKPKLFSGDVVPGDPATMSQYKDVLNGTFVAEVGTDANNPVFKHALELYKTNYGADMPFQSYGQTEWDALFILRDAIKAVGYDGEKIANWLHNDVKNWQGAAGSVTIGTNGDPLVGHRAEIIKDGKTEVLK